ncbi:MAG: 2-succinyl-6-hydroxy-2,4-cyclohexadiene-1-carboxylate synthase [Psychromonas sp.]
MPLYSHTVGDKTKPALVFLHGFLGNHRDWLKTIDHLKDDFYCIAIDLPGHGKSVSTPTSLDSGFDECCRLIKNALNELHLQNYILIGYSLGGRIALDYARSTNDQKLRALVLESSHTGLITSSEKQSRLQHDTNWATRFATQAIVESLYQWYEQDVFSDLSCEQKDFIVNIRSHNYGVCLANMLLSTSLAKQVDALPFLQNNAQKQTPLPIYYCIGERDTKFKALSKRLADTVNIPVTEFTDVGHNIHCKNPLQYSQFIKQHFSE